MARASDNPFPSALFVEGSAPTSPAAGDQRIFLDSADHKLKRVNSSGAVTTIEGGGTSGALTKIAETVLTASAASITFSSIPSTYRHLLLIGSSRSTDAASAVALSFQFNTDTAANYGSQIIYGAGASAGSFATASATSLRIGTTAGAGATANNFGGLNATISDYAATTHNKTVNGQTFYRTGSAGAYEIDNGAGDWASTAAITSITVLPGAGSWAVGTVFTLYGMS